MDTSSNNSNEVSPFCQGPPQVLFSQPSMPPMPSNVPLNSRLGAHVDSAVRPEMFPQQPSSFLPAVPISSREPSGFSSSRTVEYGHETYTNLQGSQSKQQYLTGNAPLPPRTFQTLMLNQTATGQFHYPNPAVMQHPYPSLYGLTKPPDGPRRHGVDEQWRPPSKELGTDSQRGAWMGNGRTSLSAAPPFAQEVLHMLNVFDLLLFMRVCGAVATGRRWHLVAQCCGLIGSSIEKASAGGYKREEVEGSQGRLEFQGYFRPPMERPPANSVSFRPMGQNIVSDGAPIPGGETG
ncbi:hypothetical protein M8C21_004563 [Ambrosia artemisiifolia]|uniref:Uncharacterized protein n=1 Tax=Ambrosia artemisiifolia TaxID=4212 RepID=A0AAD5BLP0_AMBAR|nr:hypothetical protein M8C21_004563 [Ambrosia artemisiifolia]